MAVYLCLREEKVWGRTRIFRPRDVTGGRASASDRHAPEPTPTLQPSSPGQNGYTLLELLLCLSILGALVALALPGFGHVLAERRATYAAHEVQRVLRTAQQLATSEAGRFRRVEARFSHGEQPWVELWGVPWDGQPTELLASSALAPPSVTVRRSGASQFTVAFGASGAPAVGDQGTVEVRCGDSVRYVVLAAVTGRVRVSEVAP